MLLAKGDTRGNGAGGSTIISPVKKKLFYSASVIRRVTMNIILAILFDANATYKPNFIRPNQYIRPDVLSVKRVSVLIGQTDRIKSINYVQLSHVYCYKLCYHT